MAVPRKILVLGGATLAGQAFIHHLIELRLHAEPALPDLILHTNHARHSKLLAKLADAHTWIHMVNDPIYHYQSLLAAMDARTAVVSFLAETTSTTTRFLDYIDQWPDVYTSWIGTFGMEHKGTRRQVVVLPVAPPMTGWMAWWRRHGRLLGMFPRRNNKVLVTMEAVCHNSNRLRDWTIVRVPTLNDGAADQEVIVEELGMVHSGQYGLSRGSLARWVLCEVMDQKYHNVGAILHNP